MQFDIGSIPWHTAWESPSLKLGSLAQISVRGGGVTCAVVCIAYLLKHQIQQWNIVQVLIRFFHLLAKILQDTSLALEQSDSQGRNHDKLTNFNTHSHSGGHFRDDNIRNLSLCGNNHVPHRIVSKGASDFIWVNNQFTFDFIMLNAYRDSMVL